MRETPGDQSSAREDPENRQRALPWSRLKACGLEDANRRRCDRRGGIIGLFSAYFLARRGLKVVVLERKTPGSGSSTRNGGGGRSKWGTATNKLSVLSQPYWAEFEERFAVDVDLRRIGNLFLAPSDDGLRQLQVNRRRRGRASRVARLARSFASGHQGLA
jgi:glycine/D-amino acid oxidase-like deaminating enzyme